MSIITYPLNGVVYSAEDVATYLCTRTSGVYSKETNFAVSTTGTRQITVAPGLAWINYDDFKGVSVCSREENVLTVPEADNTLNRVDRVVLQFDTSENITAIKLKTGTPAVAAQPPDILQNHNQYELGLCTISVPAGSTAVPAADITDTRADETVCGVMRDGVTGIPTAQLQAQVKAMLDSLQKEVDSKSFYTKAEADAEHAKLQERISKTGGNVGQTIPVWSSTITLGYYANYSYQVPDNVDYVVVRSDCADIGNSYVILRGATTDTFYSIKFESNGNLHGYNNGAKAKFYVLGYHNVATGDGSLIPQVVGSKKVTTATFESKTFSVDASVDYIVATWLVTYNSDEKKYTEKFRELRVRGDESGDSFLRFSKAGNVSVSASNANTDISLTFYHILTSEELSAQTEALAAAQAAQADADALNVDQDYRLTLLELGVTDDETTA